jgi:hypothetical protein
VTDRPRDTFSTTLAVLASLAVVWSVVEALGLERLSRPLETPAAPRRFISLALSNTAREQQAILKDWTCEASNRPSCEDLTPVARRALDRDNRFVPAYLLAGVLLMAWSVRIAGTTRLLLWVTVALLAAGATLDLVENTLLARMLSGPADFAHVATLARVAAMSKFVVLLVGFSLMLIATAGAARILLVWRVIDRVTSGTGRTTPLLRLSFSDLIARENAGIFNQPTRRTMDTPLIDVNKPADEPHVIFRAADIVGLALSGGGIRSATFNLGLLQGLHRLRLLPIFDYVSTVSGGGYVGSFWSEWLTRQERRLRQAPPTPGDEAPETRVVPEDRLFPTRRDGGSQPRSQVDTDPERHLREFSGFLAPRWGFFEVETWTAIVSAVSGLIPALFIGLSVIGAFFIVWLALTFPLASPSALAPVPFIMVVTTLALYIFERMWTELKRESAGTDLPTEASPTAAARGVRYFFLAAPAVVLAGALQYQMPRLFEAVLDHAMPVYLRVLDGGWQAVAGESGLARWWAVTGIANPDHAWIVSPRLFDFGLCWLIASVLLVFVRMVYSVWPWAWYRETLAGFDRVLMRVLGLGVFWVGVALLWHIAINLTNLVAVATAAVASAGTFAALRNWIGVALRRPSEAGLMDRLKPVLPPALAYLTIVLASVVLAGALIKVCGDDWWSWWQATAVMAAFLWLALFIKPDEFGLHAFYRDRISRAYAGACNLAEGQDATDNRGTEPRHGDSRPMTELIGRPLHLVCCAANDLSGDEVETLGRGARSAVLSKHGFALAGHFHAWTPVTVQRLGSAVTASAAAFNSNMGQLSKKLGPAVSFLMTALNLRLGLWLRHPAAPAANPRRWPGLLFYREMFGLTSASGTGAPGEPLPKFLRDVHLSDGGHFENLALYELIRRHCRYVLMSDCGADPTVAFDDLGNALRRIREDFGVDISLDVSPLRPGADGRSRQHMAVGTIHYSPTDRGILLYVKPTITGDEPTDVLQYRTRNTAFPHESTGDQFYDEAQWESYRRLGLHAAECIFDFAYGRTGDEHQTSGDGLFAEASHRWSPTPEGLEDRILEMTKRFGELEAELQQRPARGILKQVFPEMESLPPDLRSGYEQATWRARTDLPANQPTDPGAAMAADLSFLMRVTQLMEDAWLTCDLDRWWAHPLNLGWINLFARWATAPSFRFWWPLLGPMFSPGFRRFIEERFPLPTERGVTVPSKGRIEPFDGEKGTGLAALWWRERSAQPRDWRTRTGDASNDWVTRRLYQRVLDLWRPEGTAVPMQVGLVAVTSRHTTVGWTSNDFFVPPSLWGAGVGSGFLEHLLARLSEHHRFCYAIVKAPAPERDSQVARDDRRSFVEHYRKAGFRQRLTTDTEAGALDRVLCVTLGFDEAQDTLLVLDFEEWKKRQA